VNHSPNPLAHMECTQGMVAIDTKIVRWKLLHRRRFITKMETRKDLCHQLITIDGLRRTNTGRVVVTSNRVSDFWRMFCASPNPNLRCYMRRIRRSNKCSNKCSNKELKSLSPPKKTRETRNGTAFIELSSKNVTLTNVKHDFYDCLWIDS